MRRDGLEVSIEAVKGLQQMKEYGDSAFVEHDRTFFGAKMIETTEVEVAVTIRRLPREFEWHTAQGIMVGISFDGSTMQHWFIPIRQGHVREELLEQEERKHTRSKRGSILVSVVRGNKTITDIRPIGRRGFTNEVEPPLDPPLPKEDLLLITKGKSEHLKPYIISKNHFKPLSKDSGKASVFEFAFRSRAFLAGRGHNVTEPEPQASYAACKQPGGLIKKCIRCRRNGVQCGEVSGKQPFCGRCRKANIECRWARKYSGPKSPEDDVAASSQPSSAERDGYETSSASFIPSPSEQTQDQDYERTFDNVEEDEPLVIGHGSIAPHKRATETQQSPENVEQMTRFSAKQSFGKKRQHDGSDRSPVTKQYCTPTPQAYHDMSALPHAPHRMGGLPTPVTDPFTMSASHDSPITKTETGTMARTSSPEVQILEVRQIGTRIRALDAAVVGVEKLLKLANGTGNETEKQRLKAQLADLLTRQVAYNMQQAEVGNSKQWTGY